MEKENADSAKISVAIVHDLSEKRFALRNAISDFVRIYAVKTKEAAIHTLEKAEKIKLVILDLELPDMNGYKLLDFLENSENAENSEKRGNVPVLVITESPQKEIVKKLKGYGVVKGVIGKPCDLKDFREMTAEILGISTLNIENAELNQFSEASV